MYNLKLIHFNPRSRTGSDFIRLTVVIFEVISTHAPAKEATIYFHFHFTIKIVFYSIFLHR